MHSLVYSGTVTTQSDFQAIRAARERKGLTQAGLAARIGVSAVNVQEWESGVTVPSRASLAALYRVLGSF
jgi:DNA-binding transcriptional regulator YiaG